jgi:hypothetical protein
MTRGEQFVVIITEPEGNCDEIAYVREPANTGLRYRDRYRRRRRNETGRKNKEKEEVSSEK